jgi:hypothetical protein
MRNGSGANLNRRHVADQVREAPKGSSPKAYHADFGTGIDARTFFGLAHGEVVRDI